jgi:hypothetical protein
LNAAHDALASGTTASYNWIGPNSFTSTDQNPQRTNVNFVGGTITAYNWSGPNGFTSTSLLPSILNFQAINAGLYNLTVTVTGEACTGTYTSSTFLTRVILLDLP